jgi:hypothetical protein
MAIKEEQLLNGIKEAEMDAKEASNAMSLYKSRWLEAETKLIAAKLRMSKLNEELRIFRNRNALDERSHREEDIESFRKRFPELCNVWGLRNLDSPGWCFFGNGFRGSKEQAEKALVEFQKEYPGTRYVVMTHHHTCHMRSSSECCQGET